MAAPFPECAGIHNLVLRKWEEGPVEPAEAARLAAKALKTAFPAAYNDLLEMPKNNLDNDDKEGILYMHWN